MRISGPQALDPAGRDLLGPLAMRARLAGVEFVVVDDATERVG